MNIFESGNLALLSDSDRSGTFSWFSYMQDDD